MTLNITYEESNALEQLQEDKNNVVLPTDKDNSIVYSHGPYIMR